MSKGQSKFVCDHYSFSSSPKSAIKFCQDSNAISPKPFNQQNNHNTLQCQFHRKNYENVCIDCKKLLCKQCQYLIHPYDHQIVKISKFMDKITQCGIVGQEGENLLKELKVKQHANKQYKLYKNREFSEKLSKRINILKYKTFQYQQSKKEMIGKLKQTYQQYINIVQQSKKVLDDFIDTINHKTETIGGYIDQVYQKKEKIVLSQMQCLTYLRDSRNKTHAEICDFVLKHWGQLQFSLKQSGLEKSLSLIFNTLDHYNGIKKKHDISVFSNQSSIDQQTMVIEEYKNKLRKQSELIASKLSQNLQHSSPLQQKQSNPNSLLSSIWAQCEQKPQPKKQPLKNVVGALQNIINKKKDDNSELKNNKQNYTIKLNRSQNKSSKLSSTKQSISQYNDCKASITEHNNQIQSFILYGGANTKSMVEIYSLNKNKNVKVDSDCEQPSNESIDILMPTQHQQFGFTPNLGSNHSFYAFGGRMHGEPIDCIFEISDTYKRELIGHLQTPKTSFGYVYMASENGLGTKIVIAGGLDEQGSSLRKAQTIQIYSNIFKNKIKKLEFPAMKVKRHLFSLVTHKNYLYAIGGANQSSKALNSVERIQYSKADTSKWEYIGNINEQRCMHSCISTKSGLYCLGGLNQFQYLDSIEKLDEQKLCFQTVFRMKQQKGLFGISGCSNNEQIIVFGGINESGVLDSCEVINPAKKCSKVVSKKLKEPRYLCGCLHSICD